MQNIIRSLAILRFFSVRDVVDLITGFYVVRNLLRISGGSIEYGIRLLDFVLQQNPLGDCGTDQSLCSGK